MALSDGNGDPAVEIHIVFLQVCCKECFIFCEKSKDFCNLSIILAKRRKRVYHTLAVMQRMLPELAKNALFWSMPMEKDILSVIARESGKFSKGQRQIARYISENYDKAAFMTAGKLGKTVGVSESTVVRFAAELGYDGYPGMRKALQEMIRNRLTSLQRIEVAKDLFDDRDVLHAVLSTDIEKIEITRDEINQDNFNEVVERILGAEHVYILGMRSSSSLASFLGYYLNLLRENITVLQDMSYSEVYEQIVHIKAGDVFVGISYPRYSSRTVKAMRFASSMGAHVIGITDGENSPFVGIADTNLFARSDMVSFLDSLVAPLSLINALIVAIGLKSNDTLSSTFKRLEGIWSEFEVYEKLEN